MPSNAAAESDRPDAVDRARRRKLYVGATVINTALLALVVTAYYMMPNDWQAGADTWFRIIVSSAIVGVALVVAFRIIIGTEFPMLRALQALTVVVAIAVVSFASIYAAMSFQDAAAFTEPLSRTDALYFSLTTSTTVGFGDISATSEAARIMVMFHMVVNVLVLGGSARVLFNLARRRRGAS